MLRIGCFACVVLLLVGRAFAEPQPTEGTPGPYRVVKTIPLGGDGGWDYLTVDPQRKLAYVPRSTYTQVVSLTDGKLVATIPGIKRGHGSCVVPQLGRGFITDGVGAIVQVFDLKSNQLLGAIPSVPDVDGIIYDPGSNKVLTVSGDGGTLIPISPDVDPRNGHPESPLPLGGSPEFLAADGAGKAYVNVMDKGYVAVVDTKAMKLLDKWPVAPGGDPVGMSIDPKNGRLFIGCRKPQKLIVMSTADGKILADLPIGPSVDATHFDNGYILATCGDSTMAVAKETSPGKFAIVQTVPTGPGSRTMGFDPTTHTVYLPGADYEPPAAGDKPKMKPGSFKLIVISRD
jgi:DNA-binding beta-propeller fold protein YncE